MKHCKTCESDHGGGRRLSRRQVLGSAISMGVGWLMTPTMRRLLASPALSGGAPPAEHLIMVWLAGGPSHLDTFDPKPGTSEGGPFKAIKTAVGGLSFSEHLPGLASVASDLAVIRSMTSREGSHGRASYYMHTGYIPNPSIKHPSLGSIVNREKGTADFDLPHFVSLGGASHGAGFFGPRFGPFVVNSAPGKPIPNLAHFRQVDARRFEERLDLVAQMDAAFARRGARDEAEGHQEIFEKANRMLQSEHVKAFDIDDEPRSVVESYGDSDFGSRCLMARRLIEAGVKMVEVQLRGWDTHQDNFTRVQDLLGQLDPGVTGLIQDLKARGLLDKTLVVCMGEFGRSPRINPNEGRDHHPRAFSAMMAGGGIRAGQVIGATDETGTTVVDQPVKAADLFATILTRLGIDPGKLFYANDRPITLSNKGTPIASILGA